MRRYLAHPELKEILHWFPLLTDVVFAFIQNIISFSFFLNIRYYIGFYDNRCNIVCHIFKIVITICYNNFYITNVIACCYITFLH